MSRRLFVCGCIVVAFVAAIILGVTHSPKRSTALAAEAPNVEQTLPRTPVARPNTPGVDARALPIAAEHGTGTSRAEGQSVPILDDTQRQNRVALNAMAAPQSPGFAVCSDGTSYDYQHNDLGQKMIATLEGLNHNTANVHFSYTYWDVIPETIERTDRFVSYNGYNPMSGLCLGDCGVDVSGAEEDPLKARGGYVTVDLRSDDNVGLAFHQRDAENQDPLSGQTYSSWVLDQGIPCFDLFDGNQLAGTVDAEAMWPHLKIDRGGSTEKIPGDDVFHVCSHPYGELAYFTDEIIYHRRVGVSGAWEGPVVLDLNAGQLNYHIAVSPVNEDVAVVYLRDNLEPNSLLQVGYMLSSVNGADWISDGLPIYPEPLTSLPGYNYNPVTYYTDPDGPQSWVEAGGEYDREGVLHIYHVEQLIANASEDCRLRHWTQASDWSTVTEAIGWPALNVGGDGARDLVLAYPGIAFGDGTTICSDGPENPPASGQHTNYNYVYYLYEQYGGETAPEQADASSAESEGGAQMNLEFYLSASNDDGQTWSPPVNLTNTKTPGCDGTAGNECASERDPSMAYEVNDAIHILYIQDLDAGDAVFGASAWTLNPVMYYKIPGGDDNKIPNGVCPEIAPSFSAYLTDAEPDCEYNATYNPPGVVVEDLIVSNLGNAAMTGAISVEEGFCPCDGSPSPDWLTVVPSGPYNLAPGTGQTSTVTMNAGASSIQAGGEGLYQAKICITHDDVTRPSPRCIPVDFFVFDEFYCPEFEVLKTSADVAKGPFEGILYLEVSNVERFGNRAYGIQGLGRFNPDPSKGDSSYSIYDGSLLIGRYPDDQGDTLVYRNIFGEGNGQPGFRALGNLELDTSAYGAWTGGATAFAQQTTVDSLIGIDVTYTFPQNPDSAEFVLIEYEMYNRAGYDLLDMVVGVAADFDVTPGPDSLRNLQVQAQNTGHLRNDYNLIYQQGSDSIGHIVVGDATATRFKGGMTAIQCDQAPRAWIAPNDPWLFARPGGGFHEGYLYDEMTDVGFELFPPNDPNPEEDLHSVMVFEQDVDLTVNAKKRYMVGLVSSNTGILDDESDLMATTAKAWKYAFGWHEFVSSVTVPENTPASFPYYAVGSHEGGLQAGCCGCNVTRVGGDPELSLGGSGGCEGTIEFAGGDACHDPYTATFRVEDLCGDYSEDAVIEIYIDGTCSCECPFQADYEEDGFITSLDLCRMINVMFHGGVDPQDPLCPTTRTDFDCDCFPTAIDLILMIDHLFCNGPAPCSPCDIGLDCGNAVPQSITLSDTKEIIERFNVERTSEHPQVDNLSAELLNELKKRGAVAGQGQTAGSQSPSSVVVESKTVSTNDEFTIGVYLQNDEPLLGFVIPLVIRSNGAYPTAIMGMYTPGARLDGFLTAIWLLGYLDSEDGSCKQDYPGGFGAISNDGCGTDLMSFEVPNPSDPDALQFVRYAQSGGTLPAGDDGTNPSIAFVMTAGDTPGQFTIDTTCTNPANHLMLIRGDCSPDPNLTFTAGTITVMANQCPVNTTDLSDVNATEDVPASKQLTAYDYEGDPFEFYLAYGPGTIGSTTGLWEYTPTSADCPGFDVGFEVSDRGQGACPMYEFHVNLSPCGILDCSGSSSDPYLLACPRGDNPFEVRLVDPLGDPIQGYCDVQLDFSGCSPGEFIPSPGIYPDWPIVHAANPSDADGVVRFNIAAAGNCTDCYVTITAGCGYSNTVPVRSLDVNGDEVVTPDDFDESLGDCRDLNANGEVNEVDFNHHLNHCCDHALASGPADWLPQTLSIQPDDAYNIGENILVIWRVDNSSPGGTCPGSKAGPQTTWQIDSVVIYASDWSVDPVLDRVDVLARDVSLPSGAFDSDTVLYNVAYSNLCLYSYMYSDCCAEPLVEQTCPPNADPQCPPAPICVEFRIYDILLADWWNYRLSRNWPTLEFFGWTFDIDATANPMTVTVCTSANSPYGSTGIVAVQYKMPGETYPKSFKCILKQEYFMGDMSDPDHPGHPDCFVDVFDMTFLIDLLFVSGPMPVPPENADIDCDGFPTALDLAKIISYLFEGSEPPPPCDAK
jgi:hypothetical protein